MSRFRPSIFVVSLVVAIVALGLFGLVSFTLAGTAQRMQRPQPYVLTFGGFYSTGYRFPTGDLEEAFTISFQPSVNARPTDQLEMAVTDCVEKRIPHDDIQRQVIRRL